MVLLTVAVFIAVVPVAVTVPWMAQALRARKGQEGQEPMSVRPCALRHCKDMPRHTKRTGPSCFAL